MRALTVPIVVCLLAAPSAVQAGTPPLLEVTVGKTVLTGKDVARTKDDLWLLSPDGRLNVVEIQEITKQRQSSPQFRPWSASVIRESVRKELGKGFSAATTRHYAVFARDSATAQKYAAIFEETYRGVYQYFSVRSIALTEPEFPLIAIVFPDRAAFRKYAAKDHVAVSGTLMGYYHTLSNRVALFEESGADDDRSASAATDEHVWESIEGTLHDTIVHEGTHQVAFNTGLHRRIGSNPKWVVEGLATVFETSAIRNSGSSAAKRINPERFVWFGNYAKERRKPKSLSAFVSDDKLFETGALDAYSEAWALSFYLIETRPRQYSQYLAKMAKRDPLEAYPAEERLADFQAAFGKETALLEAQFLRYVAGLKK